MLRKLFLIYISLSINLVFAAAEELSIDSLSDDDMVQLIEKADKETFVLINVNNVITMPESSMFGYKNNPHRNFISSLESAANIERKYQTAIDNFHKQRRVKLIDKWPDFIKQLQQKGASVYGIIETPARYEGVNRKNYLELHKFDIKFSSEFMGQKNFVINKLGDPSFFFGGIIYTGSSDTRSTMNSFFKLVKFRPKKLLFIDYRKRVLKSIREHFRVYKMELTTILFNAYKKTQGNKDQKMIKLQQKTLMKTGVWYEDEKMREYIRTQEK